MCELSELGTTVVPGSICCDPAGLSERYQSQHFVVGSVYMFIIESYSVLQYSSAVQYFEYDEVVYWRTSFAGIKCQ